MKKLFPLFLLLLLSPTLLFPASIPLSTSDYAKASSDKAAQVFFSPKGGCVQAIIDTINNAKSEVLVRAYSFTSQPIADALINAHKRKIKVEIILDKSQLTASRYIRIRDDKNKKSSKGSMLNYVANVEESPGRPGIPTYIDSKHAIAHNKIMIIDRRTVITGSFPKGVPSGQLHKVSRGKERRKPYYAMPTTFN